MRVIECEQGTEAWKMARCARITASKWDAVMSSIKSGEAATRRNYRAEMICEILTGEPTPSGFQSDEMRWGVDHEGDARLAYQTITMQEVKKIGLVLHPTNDRIAASPDGLVGNKGLVEIKCPLTSTHLDYLMMGVVPSKYKHQMLGQMLCCEREWCDFVSYDPRLPKEYQLLIFRFHRDNKEIILMEASALQFLSEVDATIAQISKCPTFKGI